MSLHVTCSTAYPTPYPRGMADVWEPSPVGACAIVPIDSDPTNRKIYVSKHFYTRNHLCLDGPGVRWTRIMRDKHWIALQERGSEAK